MECCMACADKIYGYGDDKARYEQIYNTMYGDINLVEMNFNMDKAKIIQHGKPKVIAEQTQWRSRTGIRICLYSD